MFTALIGHQREMEFLSLPSRRDQGRIFPKLRLPRGTRGASLYGILLQKSLPQVNPAPGALPAITTGHIWLHIWTGRGFSTFRKLNLNLRVCWPLPTAPSHKERLAWLSQKKKTGRSWEDKKGTETQGIQLIHKMPHLDPATERLGVVGHKTEFFSARKHSSRIPAAPGKFQTSPSHKSALPRHPSPLGRVSLPMAGDTSLPLLLHSSKAPSRSNLRALLPSWDERN